MVASQPEWCRHITAAIMVDRIVSFQIIVDMPQGRIQPRTWFVEFGLSAAPAFLADGSELEQPIEVPPSDSEI